MKLPLGIALMIGLSAALLARGDGEASFKTVNTPPLNLSNQHYAGNREPLLSSPLVKLPLGAVQPQGWLRKQLELQSAGFHGHLTEISAFLNKDKNAWLSPDGLGERGWEEVPYWLKGFGDCAYLLGNEKQIAEAKVWIEGTIRSQREDGFFGPRGKGATATVSSTQGKYDLWPNMVMLSCLQSYYEFTGDKRVLDLMTRYFKWELAVPDEDFLPPYWQQQRGGDNLWSVLWLYNRTGDKFLLDLAHKIHRRTANWTADVPDWHNVNMTQAFGSPAFYYPLSRDRKHLHAPERNWQKIRDLYGQVPGGMFGGDENCRPGFSDPRQAIETCGMVEFMYSCERLLAIAGNPVWADRCEDVAFNSLPAALTADFMGLRYLTAPNLIQSDSGSKSPGFENGGPMLQMNPHIHRCCQHNFGHGWPYFAQHLWYATSDNGLAAAMYSASRVKAKVADGAEVTIEEKTHYPFDETMAFEITAPKAVRFPLYFRVPGWCTLMDVEVGGKHHAVAPKGLAGQGDWHGWCKVEREWNSGDQVKITFRMVKPRVTEWRKNHQSVSIERGPLTYSLKIGEKWVRSGGTERWPAWDILPTTPWNYGLVLTGKDADFEVVKKDWPASQEPFVPDAVPLELRAKGKRIPQWKADYLGLVGLLQPSPVESNEPVEPITFIPMGAARLRITAFPVIGEGSKAHEWVVPPEAKPLKVTASHCYASDTPRAVADGKVPKNSHDRSIPRFTWWDRKGRTEWIQWEFEQPKKVNAARVYWFDDEAVGGGCRTPASWRLLYKKGMMWVPVSGASGYGTEKDRFNDVSFEPVETDGMRIEVQLKEKWSSGVLEWEIK